MGDSNRKDGTKNPEDKRYCMERDANGNRCKNQALATSNFCEKHKPTGQGGAGGGRGIMWR